MNYYDIVVVGAGTAGLTAAIYALRAGKTVLVTEGESFGGQITSSPRVENYPAIKRISGNEFADALVTQVLDLGADVELEKVISVEDGNNKKVVTEDNEYECKAVIIATGAKHRHLGIEREEELEGSGISYCAVCDGAFYKNQNVAVVGGGDSALQSAIFLSAYCKKVTLIHRRDEFRAEKALIDKANKTDNIVTILNSQIKELEGENELTGLKLISNEAIESELLIDGLFVAVGQAPDNKAFENLVDTDSKGYVIADESCETRTAGIFAAGDCRTKKIRQLTTAAADGAVAALAACSYIDRM